MKINYGANINDEAIKNNLTRLTNQIYKLLPNREEGIEWETPLRTIIEEFAGMDELLIGQHDILFPLLCKLAWLLSLNREEDFFDYRRTIFECLSLVSELIKKCQA